MPAPRQSPAHCLVGPVYCLSSLHGILQTGSSRTISQMSRQAQRAVEHAKVTWPDWGQPRGNGVGVGSVNTEGQRGWLSPRWEGHLDLTTAWGCCRLMPSPVGWGGLLGSSGLLLQGSTGAWTPMGPALGEGVRVPGRRDHLQHRSASAGCNPGLGN